MRSGKKKGQAPHPRQKLRSELADLWKSFSLDQKVLLTGAAIMICLGIIALAARNMWVNFCVALAAFGWCVYVMTWSAGKAYGESEKAGAADNAACPDCVRINPCGDYDVDGSVIAINTERKK